MAKKQQKPGLVTNRRARFDYTLGDSLLVGIELTGKETKSLRLGHGQLRGAYVTVKDNQLWLLNATVHGTNGIPMTEFEQTRTRRLLARRKQIDELISLKQQGKSIVPLEIQTLGRFIKLKIAIGTGKRLYDKRETLRKRDDQRSLQAAVKNHRAI